MFQGREFRRAARAVMASINAPAAIRTYMICITLALIAAATPVRGQCNPQELATLNVSDAAAFDSFGCSVAVSRDTAVVGMSRDNNEERSAYVLVKPGDGWPNMTETANLSTSDGPSHFGVAAAISVDTVVVGPFDWESAFVFDLLSTTLPADCDGDHDVDSAELSILVDVLLGLDADLMYAGRADFDCSGAADGPDVQRFVDLLLS